MKRPPTSDDLERAATRLAEALGDAGVLVGGLAVAAWGYVRATDDIDFVARIPAREVVERLLAAGIRSEIKRGDVLESGIAWRVKGRIGGIVFDVSPQLVPLEFDRAITVTLGRGRPVRVVDLDGLLRLKIRAGGPQDLLDAAYLLRLHPELVERIRPIAEAYSLWDAVERWMNDPRVR